MQSAEQIFQKAITSIKSKLQMSLRLTSNFEVHLMHANNMNMTASVKKRVNFNYVATALDLIHYQQWTELEKLLSDPKLLKVISEQIQKWDESNGSTLLHTIVRYNSPLPILDAIILAHGEHSRDKIAWDEHRFTSLVELASMV